MSAEPSKSIIAYEIYRRGDMPIVTAPISREWMDNTQQRYAYRCLPLTLANQAGWMVCNPSSFTVRWNGGPRPNDTLIVFDDAAGDNRITSLFGHGTITFNLPYLIRTPPQMNLWVKGPTNWPKDAVQALEGIVETDWTSASFTMNWKLTRPNYLVRFERGEPICMMVPYPRGLLDNLMPRIESIDKDPELASRYRRWSSDRDEFHQRMAAGDKEVLERGWQKDYFQGRDPGSDRFDQHQTKIALRPFERRE